jgi:AcrR family transcriptional regulator
MSQILPRSPALPLSQRERILEAARTLFGSRGFETVTMAEVARAAGVARATVFNHFGTKGALVEAITESVFAYYAEILDRALADRTSATPTLVRALFDTMGFGIEQFHGFYRGVFREIMKLQVGLSEGGPAVRAREQALARLERLIARGQERGDLSRDFAAADLAVAFDSLANGTIDHWLFEDTSGSLRERMQRAAEIFLGAVARGAHATAGEPLPDLLPPQGAQPSLPVPLALLSAPFRRTR